jgi:hypothetical protein
MSELASFTDAQRQGPVFLYPDHIPSVHEISEGTEITLTLLSFAVVVALLATIIMGLANLGTRCARSCSRLMSSPAR